MRNLKRALSLTLASVMLLGMMVVGSSAAAGYSDVTDDNNVEAIEVLQEIEVMVGDERGFGPERPVNRAEMAVVMGKLLSLDYNYYATSCPFNDVYDWARGWVGACYANKIVSGRGEGVYDPGATVTAVEAASMLMRALGYFQYANDVADGFELSTVRQGTKIGIFDGVGSSATAPMTRDQVAKMVLNALQTGMVEPDGQTINLTTPDGQVYTGKVNYVNVTSAKPFAAAINDVRATSAGSFNDGYIVDLGEQLYDGELKLHKYDDDIFYRPSRTWEYKGQEIGTYMKVENIRETYTKGISARTLYDLIGRTNLQEYSFNYYVDGVANETITAANILQRNNNDYSTTDNGVLTQVFVDIEKETIDITSINTWLAQATADYNSSRETLALKIYTGYDSTKPETTTTSETVSYQDVAAVENVVKDQYVLINRSGKNQASNKLVTVEMYDVETLSDVAVTEYSKKDSNNRNDSDTDRKLFSKIVTDGTSYDTSMKTYYNADVLDRYNQNLLTDKTYDVYMDRYGYAIGVDLHSGADNYVFITGADLDKSAIANSTSDANAIFLDGTSAAIKVNVKDSDKNLTNYVNANGASKDYYQSLASYANGSDKDRATINRWYTYTVDKNGVYTLTPAARMFTTNAGQANPYTSGLTIKCNNVRLEENVVNSTNAADNAPHPASITTPKRAYGNDDSVYIIAELDKVSAATNNVITGVDSLYTGVQSVEIEVTKQTAANTVLKYNTSDVTELYDSIYTVYDKDLYIIGSVIVGEAKGTSSNFAYILTAATGERKSGDNYYWTFDAIVEGKIQTLTVESKFNNTIADLRPGHVQELRYNGEYVVAIKDIATSKFVSAVNTSIVDGTHEVYDVGHVTTSWDDYSTSEPSGYPTSGRLNAPDLKVVGRTLQTGITAEKGLTFVTDAPAVTIQTELGKGNVKTEHSSVSEALGHLADINDNTGALEFKGRIVAVLDGNGVAKWVVIISDTPVQAIPAGKPKPGTGNHPAGLYVDMTSNALKYHTHDATKSNDAAANEITQWLLDEGYEVPNIPEFNGTTYTWEGTKNNIKHIFTWTPTTPGAKEESAPTVVVDNEQITYKGTYTTLLGLMGKQNSGKYYIKQVEDAAHGGDTIFTKDNAGTTIQDGDTVTTGYKAIKVPTGADPTDDTVIDRTGFETATGGSVYYALANTAVQVGTSAAAGSTGFKVSSSTYLPYGSTLEAIDANDGAENGDATIAAIDQIRLVVHYADGTADVTKAIAITGDLVADAAITGKGTAWKLGNTAIADIPGGTQAPTGNTEVTVGYIKVTSLTATNLTTNLAGSSVVWTLEDGTALAANDYVVAGSKIKATVTLPTAGIVGAATTKVTISGTGTGATAVAALGTGGTFVTTSTGNAAAFVTTVTTGNWAPGNDTTTKGSIVFTITLGGVANVTPTLAFTA